MRRLFESHIRQILDQRKPKTILEIGVLRGENTLKILEWCAQNDAHLTSIDPLAWEGDLPDDVKKAFPGYEYKRGQPGFEEYSVATHALEDIYKKGLEGHWTCVKDRSLNYLESQDFTGSDVYMIDGDHNFYTVFQELAAIHPHCKPGDILLYNDVAGAWARKDLYYDPSFIPPEYLSGKKQGVLTAINSFLDSKSERRLWARKNCPYHFSIATKKNDGLGILTRLR